MMHKNIGKRVMALLLSLCMIAGMVDWSGLVVRAEGEDRYHISKATVNTSYSYNGSKIEPQKEDITVYVQKYDESGSYKNSPEVELTAAMGSYDITGYGTNVAAGTKAGSVNVAGNGNVDGTAIGRFDIARLNIANAHAADIGVNNIIYVTDAAEPTPSPVLTYEYDSGRFLSLINNTDYTFVYENNKIEANGTTVSAKIKVTGKGNYFGTKDILFTIQMLDASKLTITLKTKNDSSDPELLRGGDLNSGSRPRVDYDGSRKELDKARDVEVSYESDKLNADDFVLEYNSTDLTSAGVIAVKARAVNGKYAGITTAEQEFMIIKWLDDQTIKVNIKEQSYPGKGGTLKIDVDDPDTGVEFVDSGAREEVKNKKTSEKIEVEVQDGWQDKEPDSNGRIEWYADITAKDDSGYKGELRDVPFYIVAPSLSKLPITIKDFEYDGTTEWLKEVETASNKYITVGGGTEYVQGVDYEVKRKNPSETGKGAGTYTIVISPIDGGKLRPGSVEKTITVAKKSMLDSSKIQINVNNSSLVYNGSPHHPLPTVLFDGVPLTNDTDYTLTWENATNATSASSKAKVKVTGKGNFKDTAEREFEIQPLAIVEKSSGSGNAVVNQPQNNVEHTYTGKDIEPEVDIVVDLRQTDGTIVTEKLGKNDYTVTYKNSEETNEHKNVANGTITMTISGTGNYKGDIVRQFTIKKQTINTDIVSIGPIPDQTYTGDTIKPTVSQVTHTVNGVLSPGNDYEITYGQNTEAGTGAGTIIINGKTNYEGTATFSFNILQCDIGTVTNLSATAEGIVPGQVYDLIKDKLEDIYYPYDGKAQELRKLALKLVDVGESKKEVPMTVIKDYTVTYDTTQNVRIGTVDVTINGVGNNFKGTKKLQFRIKGNLGDMNAVGGRTTVTIPDQIYNAMILDPKDVKVTFRLENGETLELDEDDFTVKNKDQDTNPTVVGINKMATITGKGDFYGEGDKYFNVIKLNLTTEKDNLETVHKYLVKDIVSPYIYSGLPIMPKPTITHNERPVNLTDDYTLSYYKNGVEIGDLNQPFQVGAYSVRINGTGNNYEGFKDEQYTVEPYDISAAYSNIKIENVKDEVVLDDIKFAGDITSGDAHKEDQLAEMGGTETTGKHEHELGVSHSGDEVVWKDLQVTYVPVGIQGDTTTYDKKTLVYGQDYTVEYANNKTLGTATYTIKGKGNFTGEIEKEFKILGDLGGTHTKIEAKDCTFTPATGTEPANKTEVIVTYTHMVDGQEDIKTFVEGDDYQLEFRKNDKATHPIEGKEAESALNPGPDAGGQVIVREKLEGGKHTGLGSGNNENSPKTFKIFQRDISEYGEGTDLELSGLLEEGYEYNGDEIIPELQLSCKTIPLTPQILKEGESLTGTPDYIITAKNNINVWTDSEEVGPNDDSKRVFPEYTVTARTIRVGDKDLYDGNYCGQFSGDFQINPRVISKETIDTSPSIENERIDLFKLVDGEWECNYNRSPITFPKKNEAGEEVPGKNGLIIRWSKGEVTTTLEEGTDYTIEYKDNTKIGKAIIFVNTPMKSNYLGEEGKPYEKYFKIKASIEEVDRDVSLTGLERYMELEYDPNVPYDIPITYPDLQFKDISGVLSGENEDGEPYILEKDKDFVILTQQNCSQYGETKFSTNNVNVTKDGETATIVVKGIGYYNGVVTREYKIVPKDLSDKGIVVRFLNCADYPDIKNPYIFNGKEQEPEFEVYNNNAKDIENMEVTEPEEPDGTEEPSKPVYDPYQQNRLMRLGRDYVIDKWENNVGPRETEGSSYLHLKAVDGSNYTGTLKVEFNIVLRQMSGLTYEVEKAVYNGSPLEPAVKVSYKDEQNKTVVLDPEKDYDIAYTNNVNVPLADAAEADLPTITFKGKGGYGGEYPIHFVIEPRDINSDGITTSGAALYNSGNPVDPKITVKDAGVLPGVTLNPETDYKIVEGSQSSHTGIAETGTVDIEGQGNYKGIRRKVEFRIIPPNGVLQIEEIPDQNFNNQPIIPEIKVNLLAEGFETSVPLSEADYDVTYKDNLKAGTATVTVTGKYPFEGTATATFVILPKSISNEDGTIASGISLGSIGVQQYTGSPLTPKATLTFSPSVQPAIREGEEEPGKPVELIAGRDYTVSYDKNVMPGKAKAIITGINNYAGKLETEFEIHADMSKVTIAPIPTQDYTGSAVTPLPTVSLGGQRLTLDTDYRVTYSNNVDRGTATITIEGIEPWYVGKRTVNFDIARELSSETSIRGVAASYTYTGAAIAPPVRVEDDGNLLKNGVDYEVTYSENVNAGTATIVIKGIGKYTGSTSTSFKISPQQLGLAKVSQVSDRIYDGKEQNPPITVTSGDKTLENGKDYTLVYVNSATPGMASVIVKGEGNYTGTQTVNYRISVPSLTGVKFSKSTDKTVTISWTKNSVVTGYEIYNSKNRRAVRVSKASTTQGTVKKLKAGTAATFRVRAYVNKDGQYYYGPFTSVKTVTAPSATKITSLTSKKAKQAVVKWKKVSGATQYEVYRSTSKKGKYKKIATTKKTSYTDKKATGGKKYFYKIRVCKKISKKNYYSSYSAVKSVKAKK